MKRIFYICNAIVLVFAIFLFTELQAIQIRGPFSIAKVSALSLRYSNTMEFGSKSSAFVGGVGGISFDQIASPKEGLKIDSLILQYNAGNDDGQRLSLTINGKEIKVELFDWLLLPIAKYADSLYYSCFTLFGKLQDRNLEKAILRQKGRIMNYHPDLEDTLLGLRLFYMDILTVYEHTIDLPLEGACYVLGSGESIPDIFQNRNGLIDFVKNRNEIQSTLMQSPRSHIITDFTRDIRFFIDDDSLQITGTPYFFCWRYKSDRPNYNQAVVQNKIAKYYENIIKEEKEKNPASNMHQWIINRLLEATKEYESKYAFYSGGPIIDLISFTSDEERRSFLEPYTFESLFKLLINFQTGMDAYSVDHLEKYSQEISNKSALLRAINPVVWDAAVATLQYAAFFRYCKKEFPENWNIFIEEIKNVSPKPAIETPTVMYPRDNKTIEELIEKTLKNN